MIIQESHTLTVTQPSPNLIAIPLDFIKVSMYRTLRKYRRVTLFYIADGLPEHRTEPRLDINKPILLERILGHAKKHALLYPIKPKDYEKVKISVGYTSFQSELIWDDEPFNEWTTPIIVSHADDEVTIATYSIMVSPIHHDEWPRRFTSEHKSL